MTRRWSIPFVHENWSIHLATVHLMGFQVYNTYQVVVDLAWLSGSLHSLPIAMISPHIQGSVLQGALHCPLQVNDTDRLKWHLSVTACLSLYRQVC